jgi:hypothetical protein
MADQQITTAVEAKQAPLPWYKNPNLLRTIYLIAAFIAGSLGKAGYDASIEPYPVNAPTVVGNPIVSLQSQDPTAQAGKSETQVVSEIARHYGVTQAGVEVKLWDGTRCDLVAGGYAYEVDWAKSGKWAEAIGQAKYYGKELCLKPGIIMLVKDAEDWKYVYRCKIAAYPDIDRVDVIEVHQNAYRINGQWKQ